MAPNAPHLVVDSRCRLGEGPLWDPRENALFWVDILDSAIWRFDPSTGAHVRRALPVQATAIGLRRAGGFVMAAREGVGVYDIAANTFDVRASPEAERPANRTNDGHVGADGAFWFGTMDDQGRKGAGALYRMTPDWACRRLVDGWGIPNTMVTDSEARCLYVADSREGRMMKAEIVDAGLAAPTLLFDAGAEPWTPDGSALDAEGCLWNARWDGWAVARVAPSGEELAVLPLPVQRPTSCAFGGAAGRTLFITSATDDLDAEQRARQPMAGGVFAVEVEVEGAPPRYFEG